MNDTTQSTQDMIQAQLVKLFADIDKTRAETARLQTEIGKMIAETRKTDKETSWYPFVVTCSAFAAGGALVGGLIALVKILS